MIISHKHRFIFFAIPKTATHTIRRALRPLLGNDDWEQVDLFEYKRFPLPGFADIPHGHLRLADIQSHLPEEVLRSYYKFTFLRDPMDRFISTCFFLFHKTPLFKRNPLAYMKLLLQTGKDLPRFLFKRQGYFIEGTDTEQSVMDFHGDFSHLQRDFDMLCTHFNWPQQTLELVNSSSHRHSLEYYDDELLQLVQAYYQADIVLYRQIAT